MERSVDQLAAELSQVEEEIRRLRLHGRDGRGGGLGGGLGGGPGGGLGGGAWGSSGPGSSDTRLRELLAREDALSRALRSRDDEDAR